MLDRRRPRCSPGAAQAIRGDRARARRQRPTPTRRRGSSRKRSSNTATRSKRCRVIGRGALQAGACVLQSRRSDKGVRVVRDAPRDLDPANADAHVKRRHAAAGRRRVPARRGRWPSARCKPTSEATRRRTSCSATRSRGLNSPARAIAPDRAGDPARSDVRAGLDGARRGAVPRRAARAGAARRSEGRRAGACIQPTRRSRSPTINGRRATWTRPKRTLSAALARGPGQQRRASRAGAAVSHDEAAPRRPNRTSRPSRATAPASSRSPTTTSASAGRTRRGRSSRSSNRASNKRDARAATLRIAALEYAAGRKSRRRSGSSIACWREQPRDVEARNAKARMLLDDGQRRRRPPPRRARQSRSTTGPSRRTTRWRWRRSPAADRAEAEQELRRVIELNPRAAAAQMQLAPAAAGARATPAAALATAEKAVDAEARRSGRGGAAVAKPARQGRRRRGRSASSTARLARRPNAADLQHRAGLGAARTASTASGARRLRARAAAAPAAALASSRTRAPDIVAADLAEAQRRTCGREGCGVAAREPERRRASRAGRARRDRRRASRRSRTNAARRGRDRIRRTSRPTICSAGCTSAGETWIARSPSTRRWRHGRRRTPGRGR